MHKLMILGCIVLLIPLLFVSSIADTSEDYILWGDYVSAGGSGSSTDFMLITAFGQSTPTGHTGFHIDDGYALIQGIPWPVAVTMEINPISTPVIIPVEGDTFTVEMTITSHWSDDLFLDYWTILTYPADTSSIDFEADTVTVEDGASVSRYHLVEIESSFPAGDYAYTACVGTYPDVVIHADKFYFEKESSDGDLCGEHPEFSDLPLAYGFHGAYPNPFNPLTGFTFTLPTTEYVQLRIFNLQGKLVEKVHDGVMLPGSHHVNFNASHLASGVYLYKFEAGSHVNSGKLLLIK